MRLVIDTNILIFDTVENSKFHNEAEGILENNSPWLIPLIVIYELVWFFTKIETPTKEIIEILKGYLNDPRARVIKELGNLTLKTLDMISTFNINLKHFNDILILNTAIEQNAALATFDKKLKKLAKKNNVKVLP
ncbi:MAG: PIN domain-containing protein [Candidatus Njordarchaeia archaeon]